MRAYLRVNWFPDPEQNLELSTLVVVLSKKEASLTWIRTESETVLIVESSSLCVVLVVVEVRSVYCLGLVHHSVASSNNIVSPDHTFQIRVEFLNVGLHNPVELFDLSVLVL